MKILVLNCGSSSIKYQLFDMEKGEQVLAKGLVGNWNCKQCVGNTVIGKMLLLKLLIF